MSLTPAFKNCVKTIVPYRASFAKKNKNITDKALKIKKIQTEIQQEYPNHVILLS